MRRKTTRIDPEKLRLRALALPQKADIERYLREGYTVDRINYYPVPIQSWPLYGEHWVVVYLYKKRYADTDYLAVLPSGKTVKKESNGKVKVWFPWVRKTGNAA